MIDIRDKQVLIELYKEKRLNAQQITKMTGDTRTNVYYWLRKHNIEKNPIKKLVPIIVDSKTQGS